MDQGLMVKGVGIKFLGERGWKLMIGLGISGLVGQALKAQELSGQVVS